MHCSRLIGADNGADKGVDNGADKGVDNGADTDADSSEKEREI